MKINCAKFVGRHEIQTFLAVLCPCSGYKPLTIALLFSQVKIYFRGHAENKIVFIQIIAMLEATDPSSPRLNP